MDGQMTIFDFSEYLPQKHTRLIRKNEYEKHHCELCGFVVSNRVLKGNWPNQDFIVTKSCPNCKAIVDVEPELLKQEEFFRKRMETCRRTERAKTC